MRVLGDLERSVLLAVLSQGGDGYGVSVRDELEKRLKRSLSLAAGYTTLDRLEKKGYVTTSYGDPTPERGGRAKKFYRITAAGRKALEHARRSAEAIWALAPKGAK